MGSHLGQAPVKEHHDCVGLPDGVITVSGEQDNLLFRKRAQQLENLPFSHLRKRLFVLF